MKRKRVFIYLLLALTISLAGCFNVFKAMDKPNENDKEVQSYRMTELLRAGGAENYEKVIDIVDKKVDAVPELKEMNDDLKAQEEAISVAVEATTASTITTTALVAAETALDAKKEEILSEKNYTENKAAVDEYYTLMKTQSEAEIGSEGVDAFQLVTDLFDEETSPSAITPTQSSSVGKPLLQVLHAESSSNMGFGKVTQKLMDAGLLFYTNGARYKRFQELESRIDRRLPSYTRIKAMLDEDKKIPTQWRDLYYQAAVIKVIYYINFVMYNFDCSNNGTTFNRNGIINADDLTYYVNHKDTFFTEVAPLTRSPAVLRFTANKIIKLYQVIGIAMSLETKDIDSLKDAIDKYFEGDNAVTADEIFDFFIKKITAKWN